MEGCSRIYRCRGKAVSITYSECVSVALGIQHAVRMRRIIFSSVLCCAVIIFPHYLINDASIEKNIIEHKKFVLIFSTTFA